MSRTVNAIRNIGWGLFNRLTAILLPFVTRTVLITQLGLDYAGLSGLFTSILAVLSLAELGIGNALVFSMYKPIVEGDESKVCALLNYYRKCYRIVGAVTLAAGLCILPFLRFIIDGDVPPDVNIYYLFLIFLSNNVISYLLWGYKQSLLIAFQRTDYLSKVATLLQFVNSLLQILAISCIRNYYLYILVMPLGTILNNLLLAYVTKKEYPQYECRGELERSELADLKKRLSGLFLQRLGGVVNESADTIVISAFLGLTTLAMYQNYFFVVSSVMAMASIVVASLTATVGNYVATESLSDNYELFKKLNCIAVWLSGWCSICMFCMFQPFIELWLGTAYQFNYDLVFLFSIYFFLYHWCDALGLFQNATGLWWETRFIPAVAAGLNLTLNLLLVQVIGLAGVLLSTIIAMILIYNFASSRVLFRVYFKSGLRDYWSGQGKMLVLIIAAGALCFGCCSLVHAGKMQFFVNGAICIALPLALVALFGRKRPEVTFVTDKIKALLHSRH